jgi:urea carboxylase-associated protein 2
MAGTVVETMPTVPASGWEALPDGVARDALTWAEIVGGGNYTSKVLARGTHVRLRDLSGDACAHVLLFNADQPFERLNVADTVKVPWQAYLAAGHPLLSDQGRVLATIVADDGGRHDALAGTSSRAANEARYGAGEAQSDSPAGRELLLVAALKHGLGPRDVAPSVSFFQGVRVEADGSLRFVGSAGAGRSITLRCELPLVALIANVPHPLDPRARYTCTALELLAWRGSPTAPLDPLWSRTPELERAFLNTADYAAARGL